MRSLTTICTLTMLFSASYRRARTWNTIDYKNLLFSFLLALVFTWSASAAWIENFDTGVGRFQYCEENGADVFIWNSATQSLDATFIRKTPADKRYALIEPVTNAYSGYYGFSTIVTISGQTPGGESDPACAHFGFLNSPVSDTYGAMLIEAEITAASEDNKTFFLWTAEQTSETVRVSDERIPFEYGVTYFISASVHGPEHVFACDFFQGVDDTGVYLGTLSVDLIPTAIMGFDAVGFTGWWDQQHTVVNANFDNFAYIPEPATILLLGLGAVMVRKTAHRKRQKTNDTTRQNHRQR
jgi:hypothetical protein